MAVKPGGTSGHNGFFCVFRLNIKFENLVVRNSHLNISHIAPFHGRQSMRIRKISGALLEFSADTSLDEIRRQLDLDLPPFYQTQLYDEAMMPVKLVDAIMSTETELQAVMTISMDKAVDFFFQSFIEHEIIYRTG
jgi:hypothetical protein